MAWSTFRLLHVLLHGVHRHEDGERRKYSIWALNIYIFIDYVTCVTEGYLECTYRVCVGIYETILLYA
jgi:hypothetical protein